MSAKRNEIAVSAMRMFALRDEGGPISQGIFETAAGARTIARILGTNHCVGQRSSDRGRTFASIVEFPIPSQEEPDFYGELRLGAILKALVASRMSAVNPQSFLYRGSKNPVIL